MIHAFKSLLEACLLFKLLVSLAVAEHGLTGEVTRDDTRSKILQVTEKISQDSSNHVVILESRDRDNKSEHHSSKQTFSEIVKLGSGHYYLKNVCVRPLSLGGLHFYYDKNVSESHLMIS